MPEAAEKARVVFYGGKRGRMVALMADTPPRVEVEGEWFDRIDDPDTGLSLGGYVLSNPPASSTPEEADRG